MNERLEPTVPSVLPSLPRRSAAAGAPVAALLALSLVLSASGCFKRRADAATAVVPAPIPASAPVHPPPPGPLSEPQTRRELPPPQAVPEGAAPAPKGPFAYEAPETPEEPARPAPSKAPVRAAPEAPAAPVQPPPETAVPSPVPQLGPLISDQQRQVFQREIDRNFDLTRAALHTLMSRKLSADQSEGARRIREFLRQVDESRSTDVALARNLSERARLLAEDLVRNTR